MALLESSEQTPVSKASCSGEANPQTMGSHSTSAILSALPFFKTGRRDPKPRQFVTRCGQMLTILGTVVKKSTMQNGCEGIQGRGHDENVKHSSKNGRGDPKPHQFVTRCSQMLSIRRTVVKNSILQNGCEGMQGRGHDENVKHSSKTGPGGAEVQFSNWSPISSGRGIY